MNHFNLILWCPFWRIGVYFLLLGDMLSSFYKKAIPLAYKEYSQVCYDSKKQNDRRMRLFKPINYDIILGFGPHQLKADKSSYNRRHIYLIFNLSLFIHYS